MSEHEQPSDKQDEQMAAGDAAQQSDKADVDVASAAPAEKTTPQTPAAASTTTDAKPSESAAKSKSSSSSRIQVPESVASTSAKKKARAKPKKKVATKASGGGGGISPPAPPPPSPESQQPTVAAASEPRKRPRPHRAAERPSNEPTVDLKVEPPSPGRRLLRRTKPLAQLLFPVIYQLGSVLAGNAQKVALRRCRAKVKQDQFWYVDLPATGATAIRCALGNHFGPVPKKTYVQGGLHGVAEPTWPISWLSPQEYLFGGQSLRQPFPAYAGVAQALDLVGEGTWSELFTFSMVRNPWDRLLALYREERAEVGTAFPAFEDFVLALPALRQLLNDPSLPGVAGTDLMQQSQLLNGATFSHIARHENWEQELQLISDKLECPALANVACPTEPTHEDEAGRPYSEFYDDKMRDAVAEFYAEDIAAYDYSFAAGSSS